MEERGLELHLERGERVVGGLRRGRAGVRCDTAEKRACTRLTKTSLAAKTPPSKGVSLGPTMSASQVRKSDSEIGPSGGRAGTGRRGQEAEERENGGSGGQRLLLSARGEERLGSTGGEHPVGGSCVAYDA